MPEQQNEGAEQKNAISLNNTTHFDREGFSGDIYIDKADAKGFTALRIDVHGKHPKKTMLPGTTRTYFVVSGTGKFTINDFIKEVVPGDFFVIEPGNTYEYEGQMILFETNISPTNTFKDQLIEALQ